MLDVTLVNPRGSMDSIECVSKIRQREVSVIGWNSYLNSDILS